MSAEQLALFGVPTKGPIKLCRYPGCTNPRRRVQAAKYCDEHATSRRSKLTGKAYAHGNCWLCGQECVGSSNTRFLCVDHKHLRKILIVWTRHGVTPEIAGRLLDQPRCWVCGGDLSWRFHHWARADGSVHLDHDHRHCPGESSCGLCIRGLAHAACNREVGHIEALLARVGPDRARQLIDALSSDGPFFYGVGPGTAVRSFSPSGRSGG